MATYSAWTYFVLGFKSRCKKKTWLSLILGGTLSEWLRENDVPKPPNLWARTSYRVNGSCVKDLTSHTGSCRTNLCNHSACAGTLKSAFWVCAISVFQFDKPSVLSKTYHPTPGIDWFDSLYVDAPPSFCFLQWFSRCWREQEFLKTPRKMFSRTEKNLTCLAKLLLIQKLQLHLSEFSASIESELCFQIGRFYCGTVLPHSAAKSWDCDRFLSSWALSHATKWI